MAEIVSPICRNYKSSPPCSKRDYDEQLVSKNWMWDDHKSNRAVVGDRFGFVFNKDKIIWHTVLDVKDPSQRLPSWANNVGHGDRNVLILSIEESVEDFDKFLQRHMYSDKFILRGTMYINH